MRKTVFLVVLVALLSLTLVVVAQDDDNSPSLCTDGTWYCPDPDHPYREAWNWACGVYWAQYYAEMIDAVPEWCTVPVEEPEPTPEPTEEPPNGEQPEEPTGEESNIPV